MGSSNGKGGPPSPEERAMLQHMVNAVGTEAYGVLQQVFPLMKEEDRKKHAAGVAGDAVKLGPIAQALFTGQLGTIGVRFERKSLVQLVGLEATGAQNPNAPGIGIKGLAKISEITTPNDVMGIVVAIAMLTSPACRAIVAALGYSVRFVADPRRPEELSQELAQKKD